jgi:DNA polymerase elongation subunit (family B)
VNLSGEKRGVIKVTLNGLRNYKRILRALDAMPQVKDIFNTDLLHIQQYLFTQLDVVPTSKVEVEHEGNRLRSIRPLDDSLEIAPPPFTVLSFSIDVSSPFLTPRVEHDQIASITAHYGDEKHTLEGDEENILEGFQGLVHEKDPDMLVCPECDDFSLPYLLGRSRIAGVNIQLGREVADATSFRRSLPYWTKGRVALSYTMSGINFEDFGLAGLVERARFSFLPPGIAGRWTANKVIDSRNCYELMRRGYVIPRNRGYYEYVRMIKEIIWRDRGGMIISPKIGMVHENVAELDFASQYPNLIVRDNLSYETATPEGVRQGGEALLPYVTKTFLERRLHFKKLRKRYPQGSPEYNFCDGRQGALKSILVCLYGTSGCCWNRFGNVLCFEEINSRSREALTAAMHCVQEKGFEVVYGDTDSLFVKRKGATKEDYDGLASEIESRTGLSISLDHHYKFLILLPLESDPTGSMEAQKHYFGVLTDGELVARGIEMRRHDTPRFIMEFQRGLILALFSGESCEHVRTEGYAKARELISESIRKIIDGDVPARDLAVSKVLRRPLQTYARAIAHVSAAIRLAEKGKVVKEGEVIDFIHVDAKNNNPLCRVAPVEMYDGRGYDEEKYRELLLDAAETVLSTLGFSRREFGPRAGKEQYRDYYRWERDSEEQLKRKTESMEGGR